MPSTTLTTDPAPLLRGPLDAHDPGRAHHADRVTLGPTMDGAEHAHYQLANAHRMRHGVIVGTDEARVANLATVLAVSARAARPLVTTYIAEHVTNTALADKSSVLIDGTGTADVADTAVAALERAVTVRAALLAEMQANSAYAGALPPVLVIVEDAHRVFAPVRRRWETVLRTAGALGIGILATVPDARLRSIGGSSTVRAMLSDQHLQLIDPSAAVFTATGTTPGEQVTFRAFQLTTASADEAEKVERAYRRWLTAYPDTALDAPTRAAFDDAPAHGGAA